LTDFDEIRQVDASRPSGVHQQIKFRDFKNQDGGGAILKIRKIAIFPQRINQF